MDFQKLQKEALRLIKLELKILDHIKNEKTLFKNKNKKGGPVLYTHSAALEDIRVLHDEEKKLEQLEMVVAVVGTMKAGKSTTINAIVGQEIMPNRNKAMTALPTLIRHVPKKKTPEMIFQNPEPLQKLVLTIKKILDNKASQDIRDDSEYIELVEWIDSNEPIKTVYTGSSEIGKFLIHFNDLVRMCNEYATLPNFPFSEYDSVDEIPRIEVEFFHLAKQDGKGTLSLLDTPGPNEAGKLGVKRVVQEQLEKASAILAVMDYNQLDTEADYQVRQLILDPNDSEEEQQRLLKRLFIVVNKFDQQRTNCLNYEDTQTKVAKDLWHGKISPEHVYPVSSYQAFLAHYTQRLYELQENSEFQPDPETYPWLKDFGKLVFGELSWEDQLKNIESVSKGIQAIWEKSKFEFLVNNVLQRAHKSSALFAIHSAADKIQEISDDLVNYVGMRRGAIQNDKKELEKLTTSLNNKIKQLEHFKEEVKKELQKGFLNYRKDSSERVKNAENEFTDFLERYFRSGSPIQYDGHSTPKFSESKESDFEPKKKSDGFSFFASSIQHEKNSSENSYSDEGQIPLDDEREGKKRLKKIITSIGNLTQYTYDKLNLYNGKLLSKLEQDLQDFGQKELQNLEQNADNSSESFVFRIKKLQSIKLHKKPNLQLNIEIPYTTEYYTERYEDPKVWGITRAIATFFGSDHGWIEVEKEKRNYTLPLKKIKTAIKKSISKDLQNRTNDIEKKIKQPLEDLLDEHFAVLNQKLAKIQGELNKAINDTQSFSKGEISDLLVFLENILKMSENLTPDSEALLKRVNIEVA